MHSKVNFHIDEVISDSNSPSKMLALQQIIKSSKLSQFGPLFLDCRSPVSSEINVLRNELSRICSTLRHNVQLDCQCHVLFAFLHNHFPKQNVVHLSELIQKIRKNHLDAMGRTFPLAMPFAFFNGPFEDTLPGRSYVCDPFDSRMVRHSEYDAEPRQVEPRQVELLPYVTNPLVDLLQNLSRQRAHSFTQV